MYTMKFDKANELLADYLAYAPSQINQIHPCILIQNKSNQK